MSVIVTAYAAERYCQRVDPSLTPVEAITAIMQSERAIRAAIGFGCHTVRRCDGVRFVLSDDGYVTTVLARPQGKVMTRRRAVS